MHGHVTCVEKLLESCADPVSELVNLQDDVLGRTALHLAAGQGHVEVVELLLGVKDVDFSRRDKVREITPLLMAAMEPKGSCKITLITMLLSKNPDAINDRVGAFEPTDALKNYEKQSWRVLMTIEGIMIPLPDVWRAEDETELDLYKKFEIPMEGHTPLHLAATQNNSELVRCLVHCPNIKLNEPDDRYGMTPLHCTMRTGAMEAFRVLIATQNISAKLVSGGSCLRPSWLPHISTFKDPWKFYGSLDEEDYFNMFSSFEDLDTPLHLAVRVCNSRDLILVVREFCNYPKFNSAIFNINTFLPLELAWKRSACCAVGGKRRSSASESATDKEFIDWEYARMEVILHMLEQHPSNASVMTRIDDLMRAAQDSVNAVLVTATLLGALTFGAFLQPPFGNEQFDNYKARPVRLFWSFNALSFYWAMYTILRCLARTGFTDFTALRRDMMGHADLFRALTKQRTLDIIPLIVCVAFGTGACATIGYGNLPPGSSNFNIWLACTIPGLVLVFSYAFLYAYRMISFTTGKGTWTRKNALIGYSLSAIVVITPWSLLSKIARGHSNRAWVTRRDRMVIDDIDGTSFLLFQLSVAIALTVYVLIEA